ncbi:MAG: glutathione S-transferase N-terminal domain-containing protein [Pseudomonadota bacterium]
MTKPYILYGMAASLYTGKVRAYMRHNAVPFIEHKAGGQRFATIVKNAVNRWIIPVVETPDGTFLQDGSVILDHFDAAGLSKRSIYPGDPRLIVISHLFELFGGEGLLRPAMHYRWNFDDVNLSFIRATFEDTLPDGLSPEERAAMFEKPSQRMRKAAAFFGVTPDVFGTIEESYAQFLSLLNTHLTARPFLLGGYPTLGDYGLFNPLYAHLGRDPKPLQLMQTMAPRVFRWTERMNSAEMFVDETVETAGPDLMDADALPETLKALMGYVAEEYLPELLAHIAFANDWLARHPDPSSAHDPKQRAIGMATFDWRGHEITTAVMPYRFFLLQRMQDAFDALEPAHKAQMQSLFSETGLAAMLEARTTRRVVRENHLEVWA